MKICNFDTFPTRVISVCTVKPLNTVTPTGLKKFVRLSVSGRCPLLGGNLKKIVIFGT